MNRPRCGHCGGTQLYRDADGETACLSCGWIKPPRTVLPLVREVESMKTPRLQGGGRR